MRRDRVVVAIALFRLAKAVLLIVAAAGVLHARLWLARLPFHHEYAFVNHSVAFITRMPLARVHELAVALLVYALLFTIEGTGLLMRQRWAEWLTIIATTSFIPFELYEVARRVTAVRIVTVLLNIAVVIYLVRRRVLRDNSRTSEKGEQP